MPCATPTTARSIISTTGEPMTTATVRHPAVAGRFYPNDPDDLREEVRAYLSQTPQREPVCAVGCIVPHAGYMYSGHVAGAVFAGLEIPQLCLVLCPNHTGVGHALAIMSDGAWRRLSVRSPSTTRSPPL